MTHTALSDMFITGCYFTWLAMLAVGSAWRDARAQLGASL